MVFICYVLQYLWHFRILLSYVLWFICYLLCFFARFPWHFLRALVLFPVVPVLCLMAHLLFPIFLWYLPGAHPKYHHMLFWVVLLGSPAIQYAFYGVSSLLRLIWQLPWCVWYFLWALLVFPASFHIPYGLYAISYGRTSNIMCYLSEVLAIVYMQFPMFSRLVVL